MIQIKRNNSVIFTLEDFGEGSKLSYQLMDHHYVILKFTTATPVYFEIGDSVDIPDFGYFELTSAYFPKQNDSDGFEYELQMDAYYMSWKNKLCKYRPQHGANETSFKLTTTVGVHMNVILSNLKALGLTYKGHEFTVDYTTYNSKAFDVQKRFLVEYNSLSIIDALNTICSEDALNCEWWVDGSIIYLGFCEMRGQTTFEQDVNVLSMSFSESKSTYITRLYAFGSDRNIPKGYFTGSDADVTTDGIATDYLMLPNKEVDSDGFYAKDGYIENVNVVKNEKQAIEGVVMFEDEYPKVSCTVSEVKTYDSTVDNEDGTKTTQTFWQVTSTDAFTTGFETSWVKSNLTLGIKFTSGALTGMEFDVEFKVIDKKKYYEVIANDTYGRILPDSVMCPKVGDTFFLFNWDATKITETSLIANAQSALFARAKQYYQKTMISNSNFTCTMDGDKFYNDGTYNYHPIGEQVKLINPMFAQVDADGKHYRNSRIIGMEIALDIPYDHPQYIVGEKAATSRLGKLEDKVDSITVNGIQIGSTGNGNGGGVYVIGLNDFTPASDSNVYSARRSKMEFMSRLNDDIAQNTITWEKVQKFIGGLLVGKYNSENGGSWSLDSVGRSHLVTDYLEVRMKAIFEELVIKKTSAIGGKEIISPAGGVKIHKVEVVSVTYNATEQKAYRCYFLAEQEGDAVDNDFAIDDQVRSESFNLKSGAYHKAGNHFYWRLVIGRDENPVELEGIRYHYIDLSDSDCATDSDIPAIGDTLSQCGNRSDIVRQNCLIFSSVDVYSPSVSLYHGINSYSFANKEYVEYGVNKQTDKAFFNVYGDLYIGDRPTKENGNEGASYIKFDSAKKQMEIKARISAKSNVDDKLLSQYIRDNSLSVEDVNKLINNSEIIDSLQNQIDDAIETWYYEGKPTLENLPAQGWTDDDTKNKHIGDLYYDKASGKGYRFLKDATGTYMWVLITDEDITKALALAGEKKRIFGRTPTPPYDVDDLWVYAVYPSDGSKYNKEILRCITAKSAGEKFSIDDWALASDYATNTKVAQLDYLKDALKNDTVVDGGLILSTLIALRDKNKNIQSGINGAVQDAKYKGGGIAAWYGGEMGDIEDKSNYPGVTNWAKSLLRFDGSGYLANGNISWETEGKVNIKDLHALINTADTDVLNVLASIYNMFSTRVKESETLILPQLRFGGLFIERLRQEDLDNNDVVLTQKELKDRFVTIDWFNKVFSVVDDKQSDLPVNGNISSGASIRAKMSLWSDGGISALGNSASSGGSGGGGLDEDMLWSVLGNSGAEQISKSHLADALAGYATEEWVEGKGYLTTQEVYTKAEIDAHGWSSNKGTVTSVGITMPTGFSVSGSPITEKGILAIGFASGYSLPTTAKQRNWDSVYNWYSGITGSDTDTIINKWGEIISFLDGIEDTATLSGIVNGINQSITAEANRAKSAEQTLTSNVLANATAISEETIRAKDAENTISSNLTAEIDRSTKKDDELSKSITDEISRAKTAEQALTKSITDEVSRAKAAEQTLTSNVSANTNAINVLKGYFTNGVAKSAVKLQTARKIWGNAFDGTQDVAGDLILPNGKQIKIGTASLSWDADNNAIKINGNVYATGGISALGNSDTTGSGGGGLMGTIVPYAKAIALTTQNEGEEIASAWSVKMLYDKIETIDVSGQLTSYLTKSEAQTLYQPVGNYLTGITKAQVEGVLTGNITTHTHSQYLTSHQDISGKADRSELLGYLPLTGGTLTGNLNLSGHVLFANNIGLDSFEDSWNKVGTGEERLRFLTSLTKAQIGAPRQYCAGVSFITSAYGFQIATYGGKEDNPLYFRKINNYHEEENKFGEWFNIYHTGWKPTKTDVGLGNVDNTADANKSVNYAATSGVANSVAWSGVTGKPTTLSGYGITDAELLKKQTVDLSTLDANTWFPVVMFLPKQGSFNKIRVDVRLDTNAPSWSTHKAGFSVQFEVWTVPIGWGTVLERTMILTNTYYYCSKNPCSWSQLSRSSTGVLWLRGGGVYNLFRNFTANVSIKTEAYTVSGQTVAPITSYPTPTYVNNIIETDIKGTASHASQLQTARTIWGQRFDGTSNVDGNLSCNGQGSFNSLQIGNITISYDEANKGLRIAGGGLYTDSYLSSLGVDASTALSVKKWADSIQIATESDAELATAYSVGQLYRMINSNQKSITESLNQSVSALQGRCTSLEQRVSALENKVNK